MSKVKFVPTEALEVTQTHVRVTITMDIRVGDEDDYHLVGEFIKDGAKTLLENHYDIPYVDNFRIKAAAVDKKEVFRGNRPANAEDADEYSV